MITIVLVLWFTCFCLMNVTEVKSKGNQEEFCSSEIFEPLCSDKDEVIVIQKAHFGRKHIGRCLKDEDTADELNREDKRFIGCYSDVKYLITPKCSGKTSCEVRVAELSPPKECFNFLRSYLEVSFRCIKMLQKNRQCSINLIDSEPQYLLIKYGSNCGSIGRPWIIEALTGQKIQNTLMDFSKSIDINIDVDWRIHKCSIRLGYIYDRTSNNNVTFCSLYHSNSSLLFSYQSKSNNLEIGFEPSMQGDSDEFYVLIIQATGCSDLIPPADAWLKRTENEATIGCYSTRLRWQLKCVGQRWIGVIGNCSYGHESIDKTDLEVKLPEKSKTDQIVAIIIIGMCGLVASFLIACIGLICIKRYHIISKAKSVHLKMGNSMYTNGTLPVHANKILNFENKSNLHENDNSCHENGAILPNDYQQYFELEHAFVSKDSSIGRNEFDPLNV